LISIQLKGCRPARLGKFSNDIHNLVSDFFITKVFEPRLYLSGRRRTLARSASISVNDRRAEQDASSQ
jgi:hypothetical protein